MDVEIGIRNAWKYFNIHHLQGGNISLVDNLDPIPVVFLVGLCPPMAGISCSSSSIWVVPGFGSQFYWVLLSSCLVGVESSLCSAIALEGFLCFGHSLCIWNFFHWSLHARILWYVESLVWGTSSLWLLQDSQSPPDSQMWYLWDSSMPHLVWCHASHSFGWASVPGVN